jgi:glutamate dehydrogenase (NADP+)
VLILASSEPVEVLSHKMQASQKQKHNINHQQSPNSILSSFNNLSKTSNNMNTVDITVSKGEGEVESFPFLKDLRTKYSNQPTFIQAVEEMAISLEPLFNDNRKGEFYKRVFLVLAEPERILNFRVPWMDDEGNLHFNRGWRVEFCSVLGPYKGGLRFHPTVDEGVLKFLGFEQIFKNALTGLPLGGGKGGSDFDPKGKSTAEVRRFCQSFMTELARYIGPSTDVPAGDIGVGGREIGFMYGQYKRLMNKHSEGVLTGKSLLFGGSPLRTEATGYGLVYMTKLAVEKRLGESLEVARCAVSGSGNVAQYAAHKLIQLGAKVITMSDSNGVLVFEDGMVMNDWDAVIQAKQVDRARLSEITDKVTGTYYANETPWSVDTSYDFALPCATQNELLEGGAQELVKRGCKGVFEGANLPTSAEAQDVLRNAKVLYIPGKASNAGGVATSGFEMSQNAQHLQWTSDEVDKKLQSLMENIYNQMEGAIDDEGTLEQGANRAGFLRVANAMEELGWVW